MLRRTSMLDRLSDIDKLIDKNLSEDKQRVELCKILKEEIENLSPNDMADYLEFFGMEFINPGVVIKLKFPVRAHIFNPECADIEAKD